MANAAFTHSSGPDKGTKYFPLDEMKGISLDCPNLQAERFSLDSSAHDVP